MRKKDEISPAMNDPIKIVKRKSKSRADTECFKQLKLARKIGLIEDRKLLEELAKH